MQVLVTKSPSGIPPVGARPKLQPKLRIGAVDDPLEREADRIADAVLSGGTSLGVGAAQVGSVQRACAECEEEPRVQCKANGDGTSFGSPSPHSRAPELGAGFHRTPEPSVDSHVSRALSSPSTSLPESTHTFFSQRFGHDFSHVRIHTDGAANSSAQALGARAYTLGNHVVFGNGEYAPGHRDGQRLIAHELTHTLQQAPGEAGTGTIQRQPRRPPGTYPELNVDPESAEVALTQAIEAVGDISVRARLTQPLNILSDIAQVPLGLPRSALDFSLGFDDRCNRALQSILVRVQQRQAAGEQVFNFSRAQWSATATVGVRIGALRIEPSAQVSFTGDQFQAFMFVVNYVPGVSEAIPDECRQRTPPGAPGPGDSTPDLCAGVDCARSPTLPNASRHAVCCIGQRHPLQLSPLTLFFFYDTSILKPESNPVLERILLTMNLFPSISVSITGHTSLEGTEPYNEDLSRRRAEGARDLLQIRGIDQARIRVNWAGEYAPAVAEPPEPQGRALRVPADEAIRDLNRRAEIVFFDPTGAMPGVPSMPLRLSTGFSARQTRSRAARLLWE